MPNDDALKVLRDLIDQCFYFDGTDSYRGLKWGFIEEVSLGDVRPELADRIGKLLSVKHHDN